MNPVRFPVRFRNSGLGIPVAASRRLSNNHETFIMKYARNSFFESLVWLGLFSLLVLTQTSLAEDWPQWRGPDRDGISKETGWLTAWPASGPKKLWEGSVGIGYSSCSVSKGRFTPWVTWRRTITLFVSTPSLAK